MKPPTQSRRSDSMNRPGVAAFTLVELLVVLAVLLFGMLLLAPGLARTQPDSRSARCLNNHRQLTRAWLMYAGDNNDKLVGTPHGTAIVANPPEGVWASGWLDWTTSAINTNTVLLTDPRYSSMATYLGKDARVFKCPADYYLSAAQRARGWKERARSISVNVYLGSSSSQLAGGPVDPAFAVVNKLAELLNPKPAETWVSIDENADSINDSPFWSPRSNQWLDMPANYHDGAASAAFADGHVEMHRWQSSMLTFPIRFTVPFALSVPVGDLDYLWLRYRTPRQPGMN